MKNPRWSVQPSHSWVRHPRSPKCKERVIRTLLNSRDTRYQQVDLLLQGGTMKTHRDFNKYLWTPTWNICDTTGNLPGNLSSISTRSFLLMASYWISSIKDAVSFFNLPQLVALKQHSSSIGGYMVPSDSLGRTFFFFFFLTVLGDFTEGKEGVHTAHHATEVHND